MGLSRIPKLELDFAVEHCVMEIKSAAPASDPL
jgi:hypothetical protein